MITGYLKWGNEVVGEIENHDRVKFINPSLNSATKIITGNADEWSRAQYIDFLQDRIVAKSRRDIEKILYRLQLSAYDAVKIAEMTHAINPKDLFWVSCDAAQTFEEAINGTFETIFKMGLTDSGSSISTPDGQNIKSYAVNNGCYGIIKKRLYPLSTDAESEVAVYKLGSLLGVEVCPAWFVDNDTIFSRFVYDFSREFVVHARRFFMDGERTSDLHADMINKFPDLEYRINQMCLLDFITRQDDRHLSNAAILIRGDTLSFYPLYDNGRSLFYEDSEAFTAEAVKNISSYATSFGEVGTYYDVVKKIARSRHVRDMIHLNVSREQIHAALVESRFTGYRLEGAEEWVCRSIELLKSL